MNNINSASCIKTQQTSEHLLFAKTSFSRSFLHLIEKIGDLFGSLISFARTSYGSFVKTSLTTKIDKLNIPYTNYPYTGSAIEQLLSNRCLRQTTIMEIVRLVNKDEDSPIHVISSFLFPPNPNVPLAIEKSNKNILMIPIIFKKQSCMGVDHIVMVTVNKQDKTLSYYDPKGYTIAERGEDKLVSGLKLKEFLGYVKKNYLDNTITAVIENIEKNQFDSHNCGVYAAAAIVSAATKDNNTYNPRLPALSLRESLIEYIVDKAPSQNTQNVQQSADYSDEETDEF